MGEEAGTGPPTLVTVVFPFDKVVPAPINGWLTPPTDVVLNANGELRAEELAPCVDVVIGAIMSVSDVAGFGVERNPLENVVEVLGASLVTAVLVELVLEVSGMACVIGSSPIRMRLAFILSFSQAIARICSA